MGLEEGLRAPTGGVVALAIRPGRPDLVYIGATGSES
jgi:hypothetical protein